MSDPKIITSTIRFEFRMIWKMGERDSNSEHFVLCLILSYVTEACAKIYRWDRRKTTILIVCVCSFQMLYGLWFRQGREWITDQPAGIRSFCLTPQFMILPRNDVNYYAPSPWKKKRLNKSEVICRWLIKWCRVVDPHEELLINRETITPIIKSASILNRKQEQSTNYSVCVCVYVCVSLCV